MPKQECDGDPSLTPQQRAQLKQELKEVERKIAIVLERQRQRRENDKSELKISNVSFRLFI